MKHQHTLNLIAFGWMILGMAVVAPAQAPTENSQLASQMEETFESLKHEKDGDTLLYRFTKPVKIEESQKYPLLIFLHGAGERGDDNQAQMKHCIADIVKLASAKHPFFMIVPQCPAEQKWADVDWSKDKNSMTDEPSRSMALVLDLVDQVSKDFPVDEKRIYIMGLSMGGFGTWDVISRHADKFAAAIPICGGGDPAQASKWLNLPIWVFHGGDDPVVKPERSREMVEAMKKVGGDIKYTEYPGVGHDSWSPTFSNIEVIEWLFSQSRD
jgi:predicted peptidase